MENEDVISSLAVIEFTLESALHCPGGGIDTSLIKGCLALITALKERME